MANYKTIKQLRAEANSYDSITSNMGFTTDLIEAGLRLGAAAEHNAIKAHIMKADFSTATGDVAATRILTFIHGRRKRIEHAAGGLGKPKKATKRKPK